MDPLDKYVDAVKTWLPKEQRADILAEIAEDLRSEVEDQESARGRGLDDAEIRALLERRGHPMWLAEAYVPRQYLIGPVLLPIYKRVVKVALVVMTAVFAGLYLVFGVVARDLAPRLAPGGFGYWLWQLVVFALAYVGLATLIFAAIDRSQAAARTAGHWDPSRPQDLPSAPVDEGARSRMKVRGTAATDFVTDAVTASWWAGWLQGPSLPIALGPAWQSLHAPVLAFLVGGAVVAAWVGWRGTWSRLTASARLLVDVFGIVLGAMLLRADRVVVITVTGHAEMADKLGHLIDGVVWWTVLLPVLVWLCARAIQDGRRVAGRPPIASRWLTALTGE